MEKFPEHFRYSENLNPSGLSGTYVAGKASVLLRPVVIPIADLLEVRDHHHEIRIWGAAKYRDIFKDTPSHVTEFCFGLLVHGAIDSPDPNAGQFGSPQCDDHNCADEQCEQER